jgi:biotin transporter BioY
MHNFMGLFLVMFATLKLFDLPGFADGFQMYDLLAKKSRGYALAYPFIELALGLGYLAGWRPALVYAATVIVLGFGAIGVIRALRLGLDINCACMGNILKVPLSTVALTEDVAMAAMAAVMWARML